MEGEHRQQGAPAGRRPTRSDSQDLSSFQVLEPLPSGDGHELYRALRGTAGEDPLEDSMLWDGDYMTTQKEFIQRRQQEALIERLERRVGVSAPAPRPLRPASASVAGGSTPGAAAGEAGTSFSAVALAAAGGMKIKKLVGDLVGGGRPTPPASAPPKASSSGAGAAATAPEPRGDGAALKARPASALTGWGAAAHKLQVLPEVREAGFGSALPSPAPAAAASPRSPAPPLRGPLETLGPPPVVAPSRRRATQDVAAALAAAAAAGPTGVPPPPSRPGTAGGSLAGSRPQTPRLGLLKDEVEAEAAAAAAAAAAGQAAAGAPGAVPVVGAVPRAATVTKQEAAAAAPAAGAGAQPAVEDAVPEYGPVQRAAIAVSTHPDFEAAVILLILANCVTLALFRPLEHEASSWNKGLQTADLALNTVFTAEMLLRVIALGGPFAYLSQPWNVFDSIMVAAGYTTFIPMGGAGGAGIEGVRALRALRALRPLRTITRFPSLRSIVVCFLEAIPLLLSVVGMLCFFLFIFGVTGTELFAGDYHVACVDAAGNIEQSESYLGEYGCGARDCPEGYTCTEFASGTNMNVAGFDNAAFAFLTVFQCMTLSGWTYVMYRAMDVAGAYSVVYFVLLVVFGAYFVLNLFLAVLKIKFAKAQALFNDRRKQTTPKERPNSLAKAFNWGRKRWSAFVTARAESGGLTKHLTAASLASGNTTIKITPRSGHTGALSAAGDGDPAAATGAVTAAARSAAGGAASGKFSAGISSGRFAGTGGGASSRFAAAGGGASGRFGAGGNASGRETLERNETLDSAGSAALDGVDSRLHRSLSGGSGLSGYTGTSGGASRYSKGVVLISAEEFDAALEGTEMGAVKRAVLRAQYRVRLLVESPAFNNVFLVAILANTVVLAIEHDGMRPSLEVGLADANTAFTALFCVELVLKVVGLGPWTYLADYWNVFDAAVVSFSLLELGLTSGSGLSALRSLRSLRVLKSFRVLRVIKMFRYLESLQQIATVLISSMGSFAAIVVLLGLFWLVFSIVGLHVFGDLQLAPPAWPNCDTLVNCAILNFHTLNLENFEVTMFMTIRAANYGAAAYFISWIVLGKFILLALFLAVMLEAFESKYQVQAPREGMLSRLRNMGRRIASAAASSALRSGPRPGSGRSFFSGAGRRGTAGERTISRLHTEKAASSGPVGEGTEHDAPAVADARGAPVPEPPMARSGAQEPGASAEAAAHAALRRRRTLSLQRSLSARVAQLAPGSAAALSSLALGAPPPPFVFPALLEGEQGGGPNPMAAAQQLQPPQAAAAAADAVPQPARQLVDLLLAEQQLREQRQLKLQSRAAAMMAWLTPWRRAGGGRAGAATAAAAGVGPGNAQPASAAGVQRQGSGSRRYPAASTAAGRPWTAPPVQGVPGDEWGQHEDETYSWREFFDTLRLVGLDPDGRLVTSRWGAAAAAATPAPVAVAVGGRGVAEGKEAAAVPPAAEDRGAAVSFSAGLASLIAEAEELTGGGSATAAGGAAAQRQEPPSPGLTFPALQPFPPAGPAVGTARPQPRQPRGPEAPALDVRLGDAGGSADGVGGRSGAISGSGAGGGLPALRDPATPHIQWQRLEDEEGHSGGRSGSQAGRATDSPRAPALAGIAPSPPQSAAERHKSPRGGRVCFATDPGAATQGGRDLFGAALASLAEGGATGTRAAGGEGSGRHTGGAAGAGSGGGGGVRFADAVAAPAQGSSGGGGGRQGDLGALLFSAEADAESLSGLREPSITVKALRKRREAAATPTSQGDSLRASPLPGQAQDAAAGGAAPSAASASRPSSAGSSASYSESASSHISSGTSITGRRSTAYSDSSFASRRTDVSGAPPPLMGRSLWLLPEDALLRLWLYDLVTAPAFDYVMFALILLNCVAMAYEYPHMDPLALDTQIIYWGDVFFTIAFGIEAVLKILAFTFRGYISTTTNKVDLLIVVTSAMLLGLDSSGGVEAVKALRVLRAVKPLRALTRSAGMRLVFKSVTMSLAAMANVSMVVLLFFFIFAILGVQLFGGKFWSCNDDSVPDVTACTGNFTDPATNQTVPREWSNAAFNFDHLGMALASLFVVATLNGYSEIMDSAMATPEEKGMQPVPMANAAALLYFVAFVVVVSYTLLNLYIGVVFFQFTRIRQQSVTGSAFLTNEQTEWVELSKMVFRLKPPDKCPVPRNRFRRSLYYAVHARWFELAVTGLITANALLMATTHYGEPHEMVVAIENINYAFTCVFVLEAIIKVTGLGWPNYWKSGWNRFDFLLVASSIADMLVSLIGGAEVRALKIQKVMRLMRLARVVKLVRGMKGIRSLFGTLIVSLPAFWNVGALLGLLFYIYAYVGTLLLGHIRHNQGLNSHANFERFWMSLLTLLRLATNDDWTNLFEGCLVKPPNCDHAAGDCGTWVAFPFFLSFVLLVSIVMLNLFTAVIIENFEKQQEQEAWRLNPQSLEEFVALWSEYDDGSGSIQPPDLEALLLRLHPPLGLGPGAEGKDVLRFVFDLDIPLVAGRVPFHRTVFELVKRCSGTAIPEGLLKDQIDRLVARHFRGMRSDEVLNFSVAVTVMRVQRKWRARMRAAKLKRTKETRADRALVPAYADVVAARDTLLRAAITARQDGNRRWRPTPAHAAMWDEAEAAIDDERAAEEAAAAEAAAAAALAAAAETGGGGMRRQLGPRGSAPGVAIRYQADGAGGAQGPNGRGALRPRSAGPASGGAVSAAFRRIGHFFGSSGGGGGGGARVSPAPE